MCVSNPKPGYHGRWTPVRPKTTSSLPANCKLQK